MNIDIIDEIKSLHTHMIRKLFTIETIGNSIRPKPLQIAILAFLIENKDKNINQKDLEIEFEISKAAISDVLNTMENAKLITRVCEEHDARKRRIVLTEEAYEIYEEMVKTKQEAIDSIIKDISDDDLKKFLEVTEKLKENMKKEGKKC